MDAITTQAIIVGIALGFLYGLVGLSLTVIYNSSKIVNFVQGDMFMLGGLLTAYFVTDWKFWAFPSFVVIAILLIALGLAVYYYIIKPLLKQSLQIALLSTLAVSMLVANVSGIITRNYPKNVEPYFTFDAISFGAAKIQPQYLVLIAVALILIFAYWYFLFKTRWGIAFRASGLDSEAGRIIGIRTSAMMALAFGLGAFVAAIGGEMYAPVSTPIAIMGLPLSVNGFIAAVLGGLAHPFGAIIGGLVLGLSQQLLTAYTTNLIADVSTFVILLIILIFRPQGILPEKE